MSTSPNQPSISELQLQAKCFQWAWNTYPETRGLLWHVQNEQKPYKLYLPGNPYCDNDGYVSETNKDFSMRISKMKAAGLVPGVWDLHFFWKGGLYLFELKVGVNKQSADQQKWGQNMRLHGARTFEIRDFPSFQTEFSIIIQTHTK